MGDIIRLERDPDKLQTEEFDLLITGAGIFGACAACGGMRRSGAIFCAAVQPAALWFADWPGSSSKFLGCGKKTSGGGGAG